MCRCARAIRFHTFIVDSLRRLVKDFMMPIERRNTLPERVGLLQHGKMSAAFDAVLFEVVVRANMSMTSGTRRVFPIYISLGTG